MKITPVQYYQIRNSTEDNDYNKARRIRAIAAYNYTPPQPTRLELAVKRYYAFKKTFSVRVRNAFKSYYRSVVRFIWPLDCGLGRVNPYKNERTH